MNKIFVLALLAMTIFSTSVYAQPQTQDTTVNINTRTTVLITPQLLDFDGVAPGSGGNPAIHEGGLITFDATGSNALVVTVTVTDVDNFPFETGLMFDNAPAESHAPWTMNCVVVEGGCTYTQQTTVPTLDIPANAPAGVADGLITYTVTGPTP